MGTNPFFSPGLDPEDQQLANREFLHDRETTSQGLDEITALAYNGNRYEHPKLKTTVGGLALDNPLIVAAGWDKFGESVVGLHALGFAAIEVGTVPEHSQPGNAKPRHFVIGPGVTINRYGYNSPGAAKVQHNLLRYRGSNIPIGINVGRNKDVSLADAPQNHANTVKLLYEDAFYFALGVSSPNTMGVSIRDQQAKAVLEEIVKAVNHVLTGFPKPKPIFIKIAPDLTESQLADVVEVVINDNLAGIIAVNSSPSANLKAKYGEQWRNEFGGLSGDDAEYRDQATETIRFIHRQSKGRVDIMGAGGVKDAATALEKIRAGSRAVQIMTALNFQGPQLPGKICAGLVDFMEKQGVENIGELVGVDARA